MDHARRAFAVASSANQRSRLQDNLRLVRPLISEVGPRAMYFINHLLDPNFHKNENLDEEIDDLTVDADRHGSFIVVKTPCTIHL